MTSQKKLAINGGTPVRDSYLAYGRQSLDEEDIQSVVDILRSDYLTTGPSIELFEKKIAEYVGSKYAVAFSSGTAALHGACFAAGISESDEVITTPITFAASANCILYQGAKPIFADIDSLTYNISPSSIEKQINSKTKAIIVVDFTGQPANHDKIQKIANGHNLIVIEDAAHALGATYKTKKVGTIHDMTMFSFHPVKHITTGEGGMITTNNKYFYEKLLQFRNHGITRDLLKLNNNHGPWYYEMQFLGFNYRMTDIQAALGISQFKKINSFIERRRQLVNIYNKELANNNYFNLPFQARNSNSSWHLYILCLNLDQLRVSRKDFFMACQKENIGINVHYLPVYLHPYYQELGYKKGLCPNAEKLYERMITLPLFPGMSDDDARDVIEALKKVVKYYTLEKG